MASFLKNRNLLLAAGGIGAVAFAFPRTAKQVMPTDERDSSNIFETQGVKNVGDRFSAGGASNTHTPGAATPRGNAENITSNQKRATGISTPVFEQSQADQKVGQDNDISRAFHQAHTGNDKGK